MARIEEIERRLLNWARCKLARGGALGYATVKLSNSGIGQREAYREVRIPLSDCEADVTDEAVMQLPSELRAVIERVYLHPGGQADDMAALGIGLTTLKSRIGLAHRQLDRWFTVRQQRADAERSRIERFVAGAR